MKTQNPTPFAALTFPFTDKAGTAFQIVVVKGTFDIVKGASSPIAAAQAPLRVADEPWEEGEPSSLRYEDDLAPFKPTTDILVHATAHAPGGKPAPSWHAGVTVGAMKKRVVVTGPRAWSHAPRRGWTLGPITPARAVPVRYERAFGGTIKDGERIEIYPKNPVGLGFVDPRRVDPARVVPAPQILTEDGRAPVFGEPYPVEGFGAVAKLWQPRCARAGKQEARGKLPDDFDPLYLNAAHYDLICDDFLRGDEEVRLENLHPEHAELCFKLPARIVAAAILDRAGYRYGSLARLDTVLIDAEAMRVELTWRATLPVHEDGVARVDVGSREMLPDLPVQRGRA